MSDQESTMTKMLHQKCLLTVPEGTTFFFAVVINTDFNIHFAKNGTITLEKSQQKYSYLYEYLPKWCL